MPIEINWTIVSLSFALASVLFYGYLYVLALVRKNKAQKKLAVARAKIQRLIAALRGKKSEPGK